MTAPPTVPRVPLYARLPEIYRIRDDEQLPPGQLRAFLAAVEEAYGAVHESIEGLYADLFIDTCNDWVVPYIADLLGTTHLKGEPRTIRADVADTIALRRRKGTRVALERLAANLTGWPCRCVELFPQLAWSQHLNHQRADAGGAPPRARTDLTRFAVPRGGTVPVRDPAMLSLLGTPFDPFAYTADVKPADDGAVHVNLPNLAIYLWRLAAYRLPLTRPLAKGYTDLGPPPADSGQARYGVRMDLDPLDRPVRLFNTYRKPPLSAAGAVETLAGTDAVPGPMLDARLTSGSEAGSPAAYVSVDLFNGAVSPPTGFDVSDVGLQLYLRDVPELAGATWTFRGDNLCAWEAGLRRPLMAYEIVVDPDIGRVLIGAAVVAERQQLIASAGLDADGNPAFSARIFTGYTYGAPGPVGAHPVSRDLAPTQFAGEAAELRPVRALGGPSLQSALSNLHNAVAPVVVEIGDSLVHDLDPTTLPGAFTEIGLTAIRLQRSLVIRAASGHRPTIRLRAPLAFRPLVAGDPAVARLTVRMEGLFVTHGEGLSSAQPLIARAAVARLELDGCTLDPGGWRMRDGARVSMSPSLLLREGHGFASAADLDAFAPTPDIIIERSITGSLLVDDRHRMVIAGSIVDAGYGTDAVLAMEPAISSATAPDTGWGAPLEVRGVTVLGVVRVREAAGSGGIFARRLQVWNHQRGCLKYCWFSGDGDRLPPHHACVIGTDAYLAFTSTAFCDPGYGQLSLRADVRIRTRGPDDDAMGAHGFLLEGHKWANLRIRLREFMPVGVRPLPIAVT